MWREAFEVLRRIRKRKQLPKWWPGTESNRRHEDFQSSALPTELPGHEKKKQNNVIVLMDYAVKIYLDQANDKINLDCLFSKRKGLCEVI